MKYLDQLRDLEYERPRTAVALLPLAFFGIIYLVFGFTAPPEWKAAFVALAACYLLGFFSVACEWFWGRWFASGLGWSGTMVGIFAMISIGWNVALAVYGGLHLLVVLMLLGPKMAARYDLQPGWRQRYAMDEFGVARVRKAVTRAAAALPSLILWALGPKEPSGHWMLALLALALGSAGVWGLLRMRTWALAALLGTATMALAAAIWFPSLTTTSWTSEVNPWLHQLRFPALVAPLLLAAVLPFVRPAIRYLRARG